MKYLKSYTLFERVSNETKLFESKSSLKFTKQPSKKGAKTETYNVIKDGEVIGQIKWSSRMRGYAFLPEKEHDDEIKKFIKDLMNKRKKSKLLESNWYEMKDHIDVLSDMSLPLWDKDFNVQVADEIISREHQCIVVNIVKKGSNKFTYPEIKQELLEIVGYMDREGWEILNMEFTHIAVGPLYCHLYGDKLVSSRSGEEIDYQFDQLIVKFVEKKEVKTYESFGQNDEPIKILNDICLELSDEDYSFSIQDLKGSGIFNPDRISVSVAGKPNVGDEWRYKPFTYDDVRDVFERMIEYMNSEDFEILRFVYSTPEDPASHNFLEYQNGDLMTYNREKVDRFHHLQINFIEKETKTNESTEEDIHRELMIKKYGVEEIEECDEVIRNINDMALEVEDLGITVLVEYSPMTYLSFDSTPKISVAIIADEKLFAGKIADIDIFTDTLLSYVKSLGFSTGKNTFTSDDRKLCRQILIQK